MGRIAMDTADVTPREREVWLLVAGHLTNREIAERLYLSVRTVESHVASLIHKLQVSDRRAVARLATMPDTRPAAGATCWPVALSSFIGRAAECAALEAALATHRMVTATGPGGVGKTRLALQVVQRVAAGRRDGGRFVDLMHVSDPAMVVSAVAGATGVVAPLGGALTPALSEALAGSDAVLLLDNCEHVIDAVRDCVAQLLVASPTLAIVATSRAPLRAPFEHVFHVPGLSLRDGAGYDGGEDRGDAVALFVERAHDAGVDVAGDLHRVGALCAALDGMALAIELAAARCPAFGLDGLIAGLDHALGLLDAGGAKDRHRSMREAIAWSYRLLPRADRGVLDAISVFASGFEVDAACTVAEPGADRAGVAEALARLAEHSLLLVAPGTPTRYRALEAIRQFGAEQLAQSGRGDAVAACHQQWCATTLAALAQQPRDDAWCERIDRVADEVRAALARAAAGRRGPAAAGLAEQFAGQVLLRGRPHESQRCYEQAAQLAVGDEEQARLLRLAAGAAASRLVGNDAVRLLREAADHALAAGDRSAAAADLAWIAVFLAWAPGIMAVLPPQDACDAYLARSRSLAGGAPLAEAVVAAADALRLHDDDPHAAAAAARALDLAREAKEPLVQSVALDIRCAAHLARHEIALAIEATESRDAVLGEVALSATTAYHFNDFLLMASEVHLGAGQLGPAAQYADRLGKLACYREYPHPAIARRIKVDALAGDFDAAVGCGERFLVAWERAGRPISGTLNVSAYAMAMVHGLLGDETQRARWVDVTATLSPDPARLADCRTGWAPTFDALLALDRDRPQEALERLAADIDDDTVWRHWLAALWRPWYAALWAEAAVLAAHPDAAERLVRSAEATRDNRIATAIVERARDRMRGDLAAVRTHAGAFARLGCDYQRRRSEALAVRSA